MIRNPNGFGTVVKLSGNRRKPYAVRKTVGYNDKGQPIFRCIGYYAERSEALLALAEYNANPYDLNRSKFTFEQLYDEWSEVVLPKFKSSLQTSLVTAHTHCTQLYDVEYRKLRRLHMQDCIDRCGLSTSTQSSIRNLFVKLDEYAFEMDIISKQYSQLLTVSETAPVRQRIPFTNEEIKTLWEHEDECAVVLFMLYTGMRISETATLSPFHINGGIIRHGVKTAAGKGRAIPIHPAIQHLVDKRMNNELIWGFGSNPTMNLRRQFNKLMVKYEMSHLPHDCRHTFRSELDRQGANKVCIDLLMGHSSGGTGERVYTHKTLQELMDAVGLITY